QLSCLRGRASVAWQLLMLKLSHQFSARDALSKRRVGFRPGLLWKASTLAAAPKPLSHGSLADGECGRSTALIYHTARCSSLARLRHQVPRPVCTGGALMPESVACCNHPRRDQYMRLQYWYDSDV